MKRKGDIKMDETAEQIKEKNVIDLLAIAIHDLNRYQSAVVVISNANSILEGLVQEYMEKYPEQKDYVINKKQ